MIAGLLAGGALTLAGVLIGRFLPGRRRSPEQVEPICGCTHHHSYHDPEAGRCRVMVYVDGTASTASHYAPCACRQYSGPLPLPEMFAPEIATGKT